MDPDGDSLVYDMVTPYDKAIGKPCKCYIPVRL